jgi:hypothetical protein
MGQSILLGELLANLESYPQDDVVFVQRPVEAATEMTPAFVGYDSDATGMVDLLLVQQVHDIAKNLEFQLGRVPTAQEAIQAIVHYKRCDAYLDPSKLDVPVR